MITVKILEQYTIYGKDLKRIRYQKNISAERLSAMMNEKGYFYYHSKIYRMEKQTVIHFDPKEFTYFIEALGVQFKVP